MLRLDIELPGALRWVRRRVQAVHASLNLLKGLLPERFRDLRADLGGVRAAPRGWRGPARHCGKSPPRFCSNFPRHSDSFPGESRAAGAIAPANTVWGRTRRRSLA